MSRKPFDEYQKFIEHGVFYCTKHDEYLHSHQEMSQHLKEVHLDD